MGGATFSNFNLDAIEEIRTDSGAIPADIGHGAAGETGALDNPELQVGSDPPPGI